MRFIVLPLALLGCAPHSDGDMPLRRLTPTEYNNTVRDLFGFTGDDWYDDAHPFDEELFVAPWPFAFAPDLPIGGFEGMADGQGVSPVQIEQYERAAGHFASYTARSPRFWTCERPRQLDPEARRDCARTSVLRFAQRAWRRPLTDAEQERLATAFDGWDAEHGTDAAVQLATQALFQTPGFLYLPEASVDPDAPVAGYEMASRLSYFLWDSMPDTELFEAAERKHLRTRAQVRRNGERLLEDPRAREMVAHFHRQWLDLDGLQTTRIDLETFAPRYAPALAEAHPLEAMELWSGALNGLRAALLEEVDLFTTATVFDGEGTFEALLTSPRGWVGVVNEGRPLAVSTAAMYGASTPVDGPEERIELFDGNYDYDIRLRPVEHPADQRAGVLTLGAVLATRAHPKDPATLHRGVFAMKRLLCQDLGPPPEGAALTAPPEGLPADATNRERLEALTGQPACTGCHRTINPLGFAFESFDSLGGWRTQDGTQPVDTTGELQVPGEAPVAFASATELARHLAASDRVKDCYATQWARYAMGDADIALDDPRFAEARDTFRESGDIRGLLLDLVSSDAFRLRGGVR
ncbi:MAG: DUF1592 domain-containing protein [Myxococcota bacterium]